MDWSSTVQILVLLSFFHLAFYGVRVYVSQVFCSYHVTCYLMSYLIRNAAILLILDEFHFINTKKASTSLKMSTGYWLKYLILNIYYTYIYNILKLFLRCSQHVIIWVVLVWNWCETCYCIIEPIPIFLYCMKWSLTTKNYAFKYNKKYW